MSSRSSRIVHNRLASQLLYRLLDLRNWDELKLAKASGILPSVISAHLSGQRLIRAQHLAGYLRVLDRQERIALLDAWLLDNVNREAISNLLEGTRTDSMRSIEENRRRMLDWWAMAITRDFRLAKIFGRFRSKVAKIPLELLSLVSTTAVQFEGWVVEKAYILFARVKHATVAAVTLLLALCQPDKVTQQVGQLAEEGGDFAGTTIAGSLFPTSFVGPALVGTTSLNFNASDFSPSTEDKKTKSAPAGANRKGSLRRSQSKHRVAAAKRIQRTIGHEWHRLVRAQRSVQSSFGRLVRQAAAPRQSTQAQRRHRGS